MDKLLLRDRLTIGFGLLGLAGGAVAVASSHEPNALLYALIASVTGALLGRVICDEPQRTRPLLLTLCGAPIAGVVHGAVTGALVAAAHGALTDVPGAAVQLGFICMLQWLACAPILLLIVLLSAPDAPRNPAEQGG